MVRGEMPCGMVGRDVLMDGQARHALLHGWAQHALRRSVDLFWCILLPVPWALTILCFHLFLFALRSSGPTCTLPHTQPSPQLSVTLCVYKLFVSGPLSGYCTRRMRGLQIEFDGKCKVGVPSFVTTDSGKLINLHQLNYQSNYKINAVGYLLATLNAVH